MFLIFYVNKDNCISNFGSKEWKVGLVKVKALINSTTQQREQQCYQLPSLGNWSGNTRYGDSTFSTYLTHSASGLLL